MQRRHTKKKATTSAQDIKAPPFPEEIEHSKITSYSQEFYSKEVVTYQNTITKRQSLERIKIQLLQ